MRGGHYVAATQLKQILWPAFLEDTALQLHEIVADEHGEEGGGGGNKSYVECRELQEVDGRM